MAVVRRTQVVAESTQVISLDGGFDQVTPTLLMSPGAIIAGENFEVSWKSGYTRVAGYERFDGHTAKPSDATITILTVTAFTTTPTVGATVTGQTSGATGITAKVGDLFFSVTGLVGVFQTGEVLKEGAVVIGTTTTAAVLTPQETVAHTAAAADYYRTLIGAIPGSGPVRGVVSAIFSGVDEVYGFRDNAGATAKDMYRATTSGWVQVTFDWEVSFTAGGTAVPADGDTLTQGGVTATINRVVFESGSWAGSDAAGRFVVGTPSGGNFASGAATIGATGVTLSGVETAITLPAGGKYVFHVFNFLGSNADARIYAADGQGRIIEYDGTVLVPIDTKAPTDTPSVVIEHTNKLFYAIGGSLFHSASGRPYAHAVADGAGEIGVGDTITNLNRQPATQDSPSLGVYCTNSTQFLIGKTAATWTLVPFKNGVGAYPYSSQTLDHAYVFDRNGVIDYRVAEEYGNYVPAAITVKLQPFTNTKRNLVSCSVVERSKSQYRVFFTDGTAIFTTIVNGQLRGSGIVRYPVAPYQSWESIKVDGNPVAFFGSSDDGMVYEYERGTSFDGAAITANFSLNRFYGRNTRILKRWRRASLDVTTNGFATFSFGASLERGDTTEMPSPLNQGLEGRSFLGTQWGQFNWGDLLFSGSGLFPDVARLDGTSTNIAFAVVSVSDALLPYTINTIVPSWTNRRMKR